MAWIVALCSLSTCAAADAVPDSYLARAAKVLEACRADIPSMQAAVEAAAGRLASGGKLWATGNPALISEMTGRAGGIMMIRGLGDATPAGGDVVLYFPDPGSVLPKGPAYGVSFGVPGENTAPCFNSHAAEYGLSPTLAQAIPAWIFTGELVAALTRRGKMPVIYETIGAYAGNARIVQYKNGETAFHDDRNVPATAFGVIGNRFVDTICGMLRRVELEERANIERAGSWAREARAGKKQLFMYSMGHLFPDEVGKTDIGTVYRSAVWNAGFRCAKPEDVYHPGDLVVLIGYQHPPADLLRKARPAGAKAVYTALFADRDSVRDSGVLWIDPMWNWPDACVSLEGYDVPLLPASGIVNGAIAWEIYRLTVK